MVEGVRRGGVTGAVHFSFCSTGTLIYVPGPVSTASEQQVLALMDRKGSVEPLKVPPRPYGFPRISPDGKRVAFGSEDGKEANIWIYELGGTIAPRQLTVGGANRYPVWSADGERVAFQSNREGDFGVFWQRADGAGTAERSQSRSRELPMFQIPGRPTARALPLLRSKAMKLRFGSFL